MAFDPLSMLATAGSKLVDKLFDRGTDAVSDKIFGVPTPDRSELAIPPPMGKESGMAYRDYMDAAYPQTTPWERLGTSGGPAGAVVAANQAAATADRTQERELRNREEIARGSNRASIIASASPMGAKAIQSALAAYESGEAGEYDTHVAQGREGLASSIYERRARAAKERAGVGYEREKSRQAKRSIQAEQFGNPLKAGRTVAGHFMDVGSRMGKSALRFVQRGKRPARFNRV